MRIADAEDKRGPGERERTALAVTDMTLKLIEVAASQTSGLIAGPMHRFDHTRLPHSQVVTSSSGRRAGLPEDSAE